MYLIFSIEDIFVRILQPTGRSLQQVGSLDMSKVSRLAAKNRIRGQIIKLLNENPTVLLCTFFRRIITLTCRAVATGS